MRALTEFKSVKSQETSLYYRYVRNYNLGRMVLRIRHYLGNEKPDAFQSTFDVQLEGVSVI